MINSTDRPYLFTERQRQGLLDLLAKDGSTKVEQDLLNVIAGVLHAYDHLLPIVKAVAETPWESLSRIGYTLQMDALRDQAKAELDRLGVTKEEI